MAGREYTMSGGKPWGIRMQGGKGTGLHLKVGAVTPGSKSEAAGVVEGLHILSINGTSTADLTMTQAQDIVKQTGILIIFKSLMFNFFCFIF